MLRIIFKEKAPALVKKQQLEEAYGIRLTEGLYNNGFNDGTYGRTKTDLRNLIESTGWSLAKAMEMLRIPPEEKEHLEKELKKKH